MKYYNEQQVAQHQSSTNESIWIIIDDYILDVTDFLDNHPGGPNVIINYSAKDCTSIFKQIHSIQAKQMAKQFIIGKLIKKRKLSDNNQ
ncbi:putative h/aca ribonucleoprotein complex subunit 1 [Dermatophagoides farinae]|uniref:H/aca ribonucleoprotein complex subunit 1 n=1 Tax=Dermatophagoides farinae TaxID=6954 RepID=A0A9D4P3T6_DERFA|nr:putative h/aca ribonucleoprotein complex subunit 1 [Dermatophagoides farinae]